MDSDCPISAGQDSFASVVQLDELLSVAQVEASSTAAHMAKSNIQAPLTDQKRRGRPQSGLWAFFTDEPEPQRQKSTPCKHCKKIVKHHKKSEGVRTHLLKCWAFIALMDNLDPEQRPLWYKNPKKRQRRQSTPALLPSSKALPSIEEYLGPSSPTPPKNGSVLPNAFVVDCSTFPRIEDSLLTKFGALLQLVKNMPKRKRAEKSWNKDSFSVAQKKKMDLQRLSKAIVCLTSDECLVDDGDPVVSYVAVSSSFSIFMETVSPSHQLENADWIATDIERVMRIYPLTTFAGAVTASTPAYKKAWEMLSERFPSCYFQGCCLHALNLLIKDIFAATTTLKLGDMEPTYPTDFPFSGLLVFVAHCKDIVYFFEADRSAAAQLQEAQRNANVRCLLKSSSLCNSNSSSLYTMCQTILDSDRLLHAIVSSPEFVSDTERTSCRERVKSLISSDDFLPKLRKVLAILKPIHERIVKYQSFEVPLSEVLPDFLSLPVLFAKLLEDGDCKRTEYEWLKTVIEDRFQSIYGVAHGLSYLLDPRFLGHGLSLEDRRSLEEFLISIPEDNGVPGTHERKETLYIQFTAFFISASKEKNCNTFRFQMLEKRRKAPLEFWLVEGQRWPELQRIAIKIFTVAASINT